MREKRKQQWPYQREVSECCTPGSLLSLEPLLACYHPAKQGGFEIGTFLHVTIVPADRPLDYLAIHSFATIVTLCRFPLHNSGFGVQFYSPIQVFWKWYHSSCLKWPLKPWNWQLRKCVSACLKLKKVTIQSHVKLKIKRIWNGKWKCRIRTRLLTIVFLR